MDDERVAHVARQYCDVVPVAYEFEHLTAHFMFRKENPLTEIVSKAILENRQALKNIYKRYGSPEMYAGSICEDFKFGDPMRKYCINRVKI